MRSDLEDGEECWAHEANAAFGFAAKLSHSAGVSGEDGFQDLECDGALEVGVADGFPDVALGASAEFAEESIGTERLAGGEWRGWWRGFAGR
jgi:hypothetical protein